VSVITQTPVSQLTISYPPLPEDFILPDDPVENTDQPLLAAALRQPLTAFPDLMQDALVVSNFALCAAIAERVTCKAPDFLYVRPVQPLLSSQIRRSYTPHTEGVIPQVVMEFLSATYGEEYSVEFTAGVGKWFFYEQVIQVPRYIIFRPDTGRIEVYALESGRYQVQTEESGRYWIPGLELFLGVWEGSHEGRTGYWLRWWNAQGEQLLWSEERVEQERQRVEQERQRAERLTEQLRQLGVDPED
jgi:Putative restriction endonuclease